MRLICGRYLGDVLGPVLPVVTLADLVDDAAWMAFCQSAPRTLMSSGICDVSGVAVRWCGFGEVGVGVVRRDDDRAGVGAAVEVDLPIFASNRSSCARRARRTSQTTLNLVLFVQSLLG